MDNPRKSLQWESLDKKKNELAEKKKSIAEQI